MAETYCRHGESGAFVYECCKHWLTLRQDGSPKGRDSLLALFTTAVFLQGRRPKNKRHKCSQEIKNNNDEPQKDNPHQAENRYQKKEYNNAQREIRRRVSVAVFPCAAGARLFSGDQGRYTPLPFGYYYAASRIP
ncbi:hypothetical protein [Buttiauxella ferragutiae]|uniref:hypothetical protein n=1 Tax=Buttiauxella ferragutiae TaxID=82989 RepID=UPI0035268513